MAEQAQSFFEAYMSAPIVLVMYTGYKLIYKTKIVRSRDIDVTSGRRELDLTRIVSEERADKAQWSWWYRAWKVLC